MCWDFFYCFRGEVILLIYSCFGDIWSSERLYIVKWINVLPSMNTVEILAILFKQMFKIYKIRHFTGSRMRLPNF